MIPSVPSLAKNARWPREIQMILSTLQTKESLPRSTASSRKFFDILNRETSRVRKEKEAFDDVAKKLEHVHFSKTLKLNIGGQLFTTSLETMKKDPGSMLLPARRVRQSR